MSLMNLMIFLLVAVGVVLLLQLILVGALLWHRYGPKLLLINYTISGGEVCHAPESNV
ncbi:hypothetical protein [Microbulbifer epialgicus]|uniref:Uncharacterized protein n=1 Tax=Microbulbifer epialgicus TaxID=393907 RepID=A0ABV4P3F1_9GAMM